MIHVVAFSFLTHWNWEENKKVSEIMCAQLLSDDIFNRGILTVGLWLVEEEGAGSGVVWRVGLLGQFCKMQVWKWKGGARFFKAPH